MLLNAKTSIITGASKGIGLSTLELFVKNGSKVIACYRNNNEAFENKISILKKEFPNKIFDVQFDLADEINTKQAALEITKNHTEIDILVNNAGTIATSSFMMTPIKDIENMHKINFFNQMLFSQIILKKMIKKKMVQLLILLLVLLLMRMKEELRMFLQKLLLCLQPKYWLERWLLLILDLIVLPQV